MFTTYQAALDKWAESSYDAHQAFPGMWQTTFYNDTGYAGLSSIARHYIGALLKHTPTVLALTNHTVNSYRRLDSGFEGSSKARLPAVEPLHYHPCPTDRR